jgi:hypothetical protein
MPPMAATDWKEIVPEGEAELLERLGEALREEQRHHARRGTTLRALHAKAHVCAEAELEVLPDLPAHARVGIFARPATHRALVRFSNGRGGRYRDAAPDVRGVALKVLGVPGKKLIPGLEDATTQDFLLINTPSIAFRTAADFVWFVQAARRPALLLPRAIGRFGPLGALRVLSRVVRSASAKVGSLATTRFHSALPIRFGDGAAKYTLLPHARPDPALRPTRSRDHLAEELAARLAREPVIHDLGVQFFVDEERTPIEDPTREWLERDAPAVKVARLTIPRQDPRSPRGLRLAERVEAMSFDPWHAPVEFRPLGSLMRARSAAYRLSTRERKAAAEPPEDVSFD